MKIMIIRKFEKGVEFGQTIKIVGVWHLGYREGEG